MASSSHKRNAEHDNNSVANNVSPTKSRKSRNDETGTSGCAKRFSARIQKQKQVDPIKLGMPRWYEHEIAKKPDRNVLNSYKILHEVKHQDQLFKFNDIVSLYSYRVNGRPYFAQIRGFIQDIFGEVFALLIWLLPTCKLNPDDTSFKPEQFTHGPQDSDLYHMNVVNFVMRPLPGDPNYNAVLKTDPINGALYDEVRTGDKFKRVKYKKSKN